MHAGDAISCVGTLAGGDADRASAGAFRSQTPCRMRHQIVRERPLHMPIVLTKWYFRRKVTSIDKLGPTQVPVSAQVDRV